jgi:hypothetical protein
MGVLAAIARFFGSATAAPRVPIGTDYGSDACIERIDHPVYYGRVRRRKHADYVPDTLAPLLAFLHEAHGLQVEDIFLENHKSPVAIIVMDGELPMAELVLRFPQTEDLKYAEKEFWSLAGFTSVQGKPGV